MQGLQVFLVPFLFQKNILSAWPIVGTWINKHASVYTNWIFEWVKISLMDCGQGRWDERQFLYTSKYQILDDLSLCSYMFAS